MRTFLATALALLCAISLAGCGKGAACRACSTGCATGCLDAAGACTGSLTALPDGSACGAGGVCAGGACSALSSCVEGAQCAGVPAQPCREALVSCSGGQASCLGIFPLDDGTACGPGLVCRNGSCVACADALFFVCSAKCGALQTDVNNCGFCGLACKTGATCTGGLCSCAHAGATSAECPDGTVCLATSTGFACAPTCGAASACGAGVCQQVTPGVGGCQPSTSGKAPGASCSASSDCRADLVCAGGQCRQACWTGGPVCPKGTSCTAGACR